MTEEELEKQLSNMTAVELDRFAENLRKITLFLLKKELRKALARRIAKFDQRLTALERKYKIGPYEVNPRKSLVGQDDEHEDTKWPSL